MNDANFVVQGIMRTRFWNILLSLGIVIGYPAHSKAGALDVCTGSLRRLANATLFKFTGSAQSREFLQKFDQKSLASLEGLGPFSARDPRSVREVALQRVQSLIAELNELLEWPERRQVFAMGQNNSLLENHSYMVFLLALAQDPRGLAPKIVERVRKESNPSNRSLNSILYRMAWEPEFDVNATDSFKQESRKWALLTGMSQGQYRTDFRYELVLQSNGAYLLPGRARSGTSAILMISLENSKIQIQISEGSRSDLSEAGFRSLLEELEGPLKVILRRALDQNEPDLEEKKREEAILFGAPSHEEAFLKLFSKYGGGIAAPFNQSSKARFEAGLEVARINLRAKLDSLEAFKAKGEVALTKPLQIQLQRSSYPPAGAGRASPAFRLRF